MICPILSFNNGGYTWDCERENCALWEGKCGIIQLIEEMLRLLAIAKAEEVVR